MDFGLSKLSGDEIVSRIEKLEQMMLARLDSGQSQHHSSYIQLKNMVEMLNNELTMRHSSDITKHIESSPSGTIIGEEDKEINNVFNRINIQGEN